MDCTGKSTSVSFLAEFFDSNLISNISCLGHVINLAEVDVMAHITKIAAVETTTAIWEYDPSLPNNRVLNGSLDVIAAIRTLAIKVCYNYHHDTQLEVSLLTYSYIQQIQSSGQRIEAFEKLQLECGITDPLKIPLHSNVRWGTAHRMLHVAYKVRQVSCLLPYSCYSLTDQVVAHQLICCER
jgi:hypothetical protein